MFQVLYRCLYRDFWYDDLQPVNSWGEAVWVAKQVQAQRRCPVMIRNDETGEVWGV